MKDIWKLLKKSPSEQGLTLVEILITVALLAVVAVAFSTLNHSFYKSQAHISNQISNTREASRFAETISNELKYLPLNTELTLRSQSLTYTTSTETTKIYLDTNNCILQNGTTPRIIARGLTDLNFSWYNDPLNPGQKNIIIMRAAFLKNSGRSYPDPSTYNIETKIRILNTVIVKD